MRKSPTRGRVDTAAHVAVRTAAHSAARGAALLAALLCALLLTACADEAGDPPASTNADATRAESTPAPARSAENAEADSGLVRAKASKGEKAARHPNERPVPGFEGRTLAGTKLSMQSLLGSRVVLFFFDPDDAKAAPVGRAVQALHERGAENNFRVVGVGLRAGPPALSKFVREQGFEFPVIDDSGGAIARQLRLNVPLAILGVDADGYVTFGLSYFPPPQDAEAAALDQLADAMRVRFDEGADGALYAWPAAPPLGVVSMADGAKLETADLAGEAAIVIFFLHTCPHCHKALEAIEQIMDGLPADQRPALVAVSVQNNPTAIRRSLEDLGLDFFTPYLDPNGDATEAWGVTGGVPVVNVVDAEGRIRHRSEGWNEKRDAAMLRMQVARATGTRVPMLLDPKGYSGNDVCGVCHEQEHATWEYTKHATAFDTLVTHEADRRKDCVGCHVVGYEEPGGYDFYRRPAHLEDVGCESCHGRGGPHLSPTFVPLVDGERDYASVCGTCHNQTHSLGFEYATFHPRVSHARIAAMSNAERSELLEGGGPARELLPTSADYVGSEACQSCHAKEFETWVASPHAHAVATLEKEDKAADADCLQCHTTAYGKTGGFPSGAPVADHPDLARVGCESCHGPGSDHIGESAKRVGTILSLGDKCDSCVILKVCGSCHDDANDPGFRFEVEQRIDDQRHGTIESAATRAGLSAFHDAREHRDDAREHRDDAREHRDDARDRDAEGEHRGRAGTELDASALAARDRALLRHVFEHTARSAPPTPPTPPMQTRGERG